jgi:hypothetical protein
MYLERWTIDELTESTATLLRSVYRGEIDATATGAGATATWSLWTEPPAALARAGRAARSLNWSITFAGRPQGRRWIARQPV